MTVYEKRIVPEVELKHLEVKVNNGRFEDAVKRFKMMVQSEGIINSWKMHQAYEKPSEKKRRKKREAAARLFLQNLRDQQILSGEFEKKIKQKEKKKAAKLEARRKAAVSAGDNNE